MQWQMLCPDDRIATSWTANWDGFAFCGKDGPFFATTLQPRACDVAYDKALGEDVFRVVQKFFESKMPRFSARSNP